jgi:hypothetical protein
MEEKHSTKDRIEQVALELFARKGYQSVSIRDICKLVGIQGKRKDWFPYRNASSFSFFNNYHNILL